MGNEATKYLGYPVESMSNVCMSCVPSVEIMCDNMPINCNENVSDPREKLFYHMYKFSTLNSLHERLEDSWNTDMNDTLRIIFYFRDIKGEGKKLIFKEACLWLLMNKANSLDKNYRYIPEYGSWKDLFSIFAGTMYEPEIVKYYAQKIRESLLLLKDGKISEIDFGISKYAPNEGSEYDKKYRLVSKIIRELGITKEEYRKNYIRPLRKINPTIEELMCAGRWNDIDFSKIPHGAFHKYESALKRKCPEKYKEHIYCKSNSRKEFDNRESVVYHISNYISDGCGYDGLEKYLKEKGYGEIMENRDKMLCVFDTSKKMYETKNSAIYRPISVILAISRVCGEWISFSEEPRINDFNTIFSCNEEESNLISSYTYFVKLYEFILSLATKKIEKLPKSIIIVADYSSTELLSAYEKVNWKSIEADYENCGLEAPTVVFWNPRNITNNPYINIDNKYFTIIEGYTLKILNHLIENKTFDSYKYMRSVIDSERYSKICYT